MSCPNCPCAACASERTTEAARRRSYIQQVGLSEPECAYVRITREYAERGESIPAGLLLCCPCKRCNPTTL